MSRRTRDSRKGPRGCVPDNFEAPVAGIAYFPVAVEIEDAEDAVLTFSVPHPPCPLIALPDGEQLLVSGEDCDVVITGFESDLPFAEAYTEIEGTVSWDEDGLRIDILSRVRFTTVPDGFPDWIDEPTSCESRYELVRADTCAVRSERRCATSASSARSSGIIRPRAVSRARIR